MGFGSRTPLLRYSSLLNGPNQSKDDGLQAWERVLRAQNVGDENVHVPIYHRGKAGELSVSDKELETLAT